MEQRPVYVIGHRNPDVDSICSAIAYAHLKNLLGQDNVRPARAGEIDEETAYVLRQFDQAVPELLVDAAGLDLILVDHNEVGQALPHIESANILEIWEHHRIGDLRLPKPIVFHCEPVGATATLIAEQYFVHSFTPSLAMAGLLLASILSDTVVFRSPTASEKDHRMVAMLQPIAAIDPGAFGQRMLDVKATATERKSAAGIVNDDLKEFVLGGQRVAIAQVQVTRPNAFVGRKEEILSEMRALRECQGLAQVILMITNINAHASDLWCIGDRRDLFEQAFGSLKDDAVHVEGLMSRKKQVVPPLEAVFTRSADRLELVDPGRIPINGTLRSLTSSGR